MNVFTRINRLERLLRRNVRGNKYTMPDGSWRVLKYGHNGFYDAVQGIDSPEARIVTNAVTDNNHGLMLKLLFVTMNPVDTGTIIEPTQQVEEESVTTAA